MNVLYRGKLTFHTPCLLTGADQNMPEIRVPSIRGELRWWFRAVGGTLEDEVGVFGGVHGGAAASSISLRVREMSIVKGESLEFKPMSDMGYLYYFAKVSGNNSGVHRTAAGAYVGVGSSFVLEVLERRVLTENQRGLLKDALAYFLRYGALGLRSTRGCGAFVADPVPELPEREDICVGCVSKETFSTGLKCQQELGRFLRALRGENNISGKRESALGYSLGRARASSALRLRPVRLENGKFAPYVVYTDRFSRESSLMSLVRRQLV